CQPSGAADGFTRQFATWWRQHYARLADGSTSVSFLDCWSGNLSVPRARFLEAGGFATDLQRLEDVDLGYRLERLGLPLVYLPSAIGHQDYRKGCAAAATASSASRNCSSTASRAACRRSAPSLSPSMTDTLILLTLRVRSFASMASRPPCLSSAVPWARATTGTVAVLWVVARCCP